MKYTDIAVIGGGLAGSTAAAMLAELGGTLVVPMTLLRQEYRDEIFGGLAARRASGIRQLESFQ